MQTLTFNSSTLPVPKRSTAIECFWSTNLLMNIDAMWPARAPEFVMQGCSLPGMSISTIAGNASRMSRTSSQALAADDEVVLCIAKNTTVKVHSRGKPERIFAPGEAHIWQADKETICEVAGPYEATMIRIPTQAFARASLDLDYILDKGSAEPTAELTLLVDYAENLLANSKHLSVEAACAAAGHLREMAMLALRPGCNEDAPAEATCNQSRLRLARIKADIRAHLCHPDLAPQWIADREGISTRYMRELFASEQTSFRDFVLHHRLELAYARLIQSDSWARPISTIAFEAGFSDLSYFCRAFKKYFNMTPSDARNIAKSAPDYSAHRR